MFTGIVEELGIVKQVRFLSNLSVLRISAKKISKQTKLGESIAINGVCLTVTEIKGNVLTFDVVRETILRTTLNSLKVNDKVNLEQALKVGNRVSGHFVTGHVDCIGIIKNTIRTKNYLELQIKIDKPLRKYIVTKGSICIDGVSLTIGKVFKDYFSIYLIPFTKKVTILGAKQEQGRVNVEVDILAKYIYG